MIALLIAALLPQTVTFTHPCARAEVVFEALGKEIGRTIKPSGSVQKDYFLVRFDGVSEDEALEKIAETLNAEWTEKEGVLYLARTDQQINWEKKKSLEYDAKVLSDKIPKINPSEVYDKEFMRSAAIEALDYMKKANETGQYDGRKQLTLERRSPVARFLARVVPEIGIERIVDAGEFGIVEYVPHPGIMQRVLPLGNAFQMFQREAEEYRAAIDVELQEKLSPFDYMSPLAAPFRKGEFYQYFYDALRVRKTSGDLMISYYSKEGGDYDTLYSLRERNASGIDASLLNQDGLYASSDLENEFAVFLKSIGKGGDDTPIEKGRLFSILSNPAIHEPLELFGSRWLLESAKAQGKNIVALLSDDVWALSAIQIARNASQYRSLWREIGNVESGYEANVVDSWIMVAPRKRDVARDSRVDRVKLSRALRAVIEARPPTLEEQGDYNSLCDQSDIPQLASGLASFLIGGNPYRGQFGHNSVGAYRIYGNLSLQQQAQVIHGGLEMQIAGLPANLRRAVGVLALTDFVQISPEPLRPPNYSHFGRDMTFSNDPVKVLANGFPFGSTVRLRIETKTLLFRKPEKSEDPPLLIHDSVSGFVAHEQIDELPQPKYLSFFTTMVARVLVIDLAWSQIGYQTTIAEERPVPLNAAWVPIENLPTELQSVARTALIPVPARPRGVERGGGGG